MYELMQSTGFLMFGCVVLFGLVFYVLGGCVSVGVLFVLRD